MEPGREALFRLLAGRGTPEEDERVHEALRDPESPLHAYIDDYCAASARAVEPSVVAGVLRRGHPGGAGIRPSFWRSGRGSRIAMRVAASLLVVGILGAGSAALVWKDQLDRLEAEIARLGLASPVRFDSSGVFVNEGHDRVAVAGYVNESFVRRASVAWDEDQPPLVVYEGPAEPPPGGALKRFEARSLALDLDYRVITPTLIVEPYPGIAARFPDFFRQTTFARHFLLSMDGIIPDPDVESAREPVWLKVPSRPISLRLDDPGYEFGGISRRDGWAVVLIRAERPASSWYVQNFGQPIRVEIGKPFTVPCALSPGVSRFDIKAVVFPTLGDSPFDGETTLQSIPTSDAHGRRLESTDTMAFTVVRPGDSQSDRPDAGPDSPREAEILSPEPESQVDRIEILEGRMNVDGHPVILVRPEVSGQPWVVQPPVAAVAADGTFSSRVYFGDDASRPGTRFRVIIVPAGDRRAAENYTEGMRIQSLPLNLPRSKMISVRR